MDYKTFSIISNFYLSKLVPFQKRSMFSHFISSVKVNKPTYLIRYVTCKQGPLKQMDGIATKC